jgi:hypothetical protein
MVTVRIALSIVHITLAIAGLYADLRFRFRHKQRIDYGCLTLICVTPALYWAFIYALRNGFGGWV